MENFNIENIDFENETSPNSFRPISWDNYIGQELIKKNLNVFIHSCKKRGESLDHILFYGPAGLGKTTIAHIISNQMDSKLKTSSAPMIEKRGDLAAVLTNLEQGDILFIDEIHRLNPAIEEILYPAMEDYKLDIIVGSGVAAQTIQIDLPHFTLIGATTRLGSISTPLRDRFGMSFHLQFYTNKELAQIINIASNSLDIKITKEASLELANASRGTPRIALNILKRIRDFAQFNNEKTISLERCKEGLNSLGINKEGLDSFDIKLIKLLIKNKDKAIGLSTLATMLNEDKGMIEFAIEPYLISNDFIIKTTKGRIASNKSLRLYS
jgi:Holliday junction DNA helicase RuvB